MQKLEKYSKTENNDQTNKERMQHLRNSCEKVENTRKHWKTCKTSNICELFKNTGNMFGKLTTSTKTSK